jgi:hypothetical protein
MAHPRTDMYTRNPADVKAITRPEIGTLTVHKYVGKAAENRNRASWRSSGNVCRTVSNFHF